MTKQSQTKLYLAALNYCWTDPIVKFFDPYTDCNNTIEVERFEYIHACNSLGVFRGFRIQAPLQ